MIDHYTAIDNKGKKTKISIDDAKKIGQRGGEGTVYHISSPITYSNFCAKIYHDNIINDSSNIQIRHKKIQFMVNTSVISNNSSVVICWPIELIYNSKNKFIGFIMLKAPNESEQLEWFIHSYKLNNRFSTTQFNVFDSGNNDFSRALYNRLVVCNNIAYAINMIHMSGNYTLVDAKPQNILINSNGNVAMVDMDSIQISENSQILFHAPVLTPDYTPPEGFNNVIPFKQTNWDYFSYAVMAYQIIMVCHPYIGKYKAPFHKGDELIDNIKAGLFLHGTKRAYLVSIQGLEDVFKIWNFLPLSIRTLFSNAFEGVAHKRPNIQTWGKTLSLEMKNLWSTIGALSQPQFCLRCGIQRRADGYFCPKCGNKY